MYADLKIDTFLQHTMVKHETSRNFTKENIDKQAKSTVENILGILLLLSNCNYK